jgi:hypothetical protein
MREKTLRDLGRRWPAPKQVERGLTLLMERVRREGEREGGREGGRDSCVLAMIIFCAIPAEFFLTVL